MIIFGNGGALLACVPAPATGLTARRGTYVLCSIVSPGRSRGGFSTKIHLKADLDGLPLAFHLTEGQASDSPQFEILLDLGPDITPRAAVGDKGYDSTGNRTAARERGICPVIPFKSSARNRPAFFPKALYRARARIEQLVGKLKRFKRVALRCEKTNKNFGSFVAFALGLIIVKSVHTA